MTTLTLDLHNLTIQLPADKIILDREEYGNLKHQNDLGRYLSLSQVLDLLSVSRPWLLEKVLLNPSIRPQIDIDQNPDGFVKYPINRGGKYLFLASKTKAYFEEHFTDILTS
ncbi:DUF771 domain-containing protein [uncultured Streptococcus sp.]|uniref:DUF771 domain-containing protein n=1 Tax=uncultured Streptococcus sp. TaxID=83427 RepID=UPI0027DC882B|nr:DUF771 domain-containing protein [uncultured Streptococcus sp.]